MTDKLQAAINKATQAESLLRNDAFKSAVKLLEEEYIKGWAATAPAERDARENYWRAVQVLADITRHLGFAVNNGKIAQSELDALAHQDKVTNLRRR